MHKPISVVLLALALAIPQLAQAADAPAELEADRDYHRVTPAQPTDVAPGQVEVLEFFWYGCPHCYQAEAEVNAWLEDKPEGVTFTRVPATVNRGWVLMAQAYYTAEQLDVLDVAADGRAACRLLPAARGCRAGRFHRRLQLPDGRLESAARRCAGAALRHSRRSDDDRERKVHDQSDADARLRPDA